jgi:hypothetical protein
MSDAVFFQQGNQAGILLRSYAHSCCWSASCLSSDFTAEIGKNAGDALLQYQATLEKLSGHSYLLPDVGGAIMAPDIIIAF